MGSGNRFPYKTSTVLDQDFLDSCRDVQTNDLQLVVDIQNPAGGFIRASDRSKYVDGTYYSALLKFPVISRTVGEWLDNSIEFSDLRLRLSNVNGDLNSILPGGADYAGWVGKTVDVKLGLRDVGSTYTTIFSGAVTPTGGLGRDVQSLDLQVRDKLDVVTTPFPDTVFKVADFPDISEDLVGKGIPIIYGPWNTELTNPADVQAFVVNSLDTDMNGDVARTTNVRLIISENENRSFDTTKVYVVRSDVFHPIDSADITGVSLNRDFQIVQDSGNTLITLDDGSTINYVWEQGDVYCVQVEGKSISAGIHNNIVAIAKDLLETYGGLTGGDFDANWTTYINKNSPAQSAIFSIPARLWRQQALNTLEEVKSLLSQVRLEVFVSRDLKFKLNSLHFEDWDPDPALRIDNFDVVKNTFKPRISTRNNFNRTKAFYNRLPKSGENERESGFFRNAASISQSGQTVAKGVVFPNLIDKDDVENQLVEIVRISSGFIEHIEFEATWRLLLLDIGDFVKLNVQIGSVIYEDVPCMVRSIGYDPNGLKLPLKLWCMQALPFPGWAGAGAGITGGYNAVITEE